MGHGRQMTRFEHTVRLFEGFDRGLVLDAAVGTGRTTRRLREIGYEVVGADIGARPLTDIGVPTFVADLNADMPFADRVFDCVCTQNTVEYLEDQFHFLRECNRVLKPGGRIVLETPNVLGLRHRLLAFLTGFPLHPHPFREEGQSFGKNRANLKTYFQLRWMLHKCGFRLETCSVPDYSNQALFLAPAWLPLAFCSWWSFRGERDPAQRAVRRDALRTALSADLVFGRQLFLVALKVAECPRTYNKRHAPAAPTAALSEDVNPACDVVAEDGTSMAKDERSVQPLVERVAACPACGGSPLEFRASPSPAYRCSACERHYAFREGSVFALVDEAQTRRGSGLR